jgi:hypothetical protein
VRGLRIGYIGKLRLPGIKALAQPWLKMFALLLIHIAGVVAAAFAAAWDIETILFSGPLLSVFGVLLALIAFRRNRPICLYYALTTPTVSVFCFAWIFAMDWGPGDAQRPIGAFLAIFGLVNLMFGILALSESLEKPKNLPKRGPFQFSIASIMGLTLLVAVSLSLWRTFHQQGIAFAAILCHLAVLFFVLHRFHNREITDAGD